MSIALRKVLLWRGTILLLAILTSNMSFSILIRSKAFVKNANEKFRVGDFGEWKCYGMM